MIDEKKLIEGLEESQAKIEFALKGCKVNEFIQVKAVNRIINELAEEYNNESVKEDLISRSAFAKSIECMAQNGWDMSIGEYSWDNINDFIDSLYELLQDEPTAYNDEWIPCSERLPEEGVDVLVWYEYYRYGEYNSMYQTYGIGYQFDGHWSGDVNGTKARCIAWKPLPPAYQPKGE